MNMERSIPKSINFQDVLPVAVPAVARRRRFYPQNGTTFNAAGSSEIRIDVGSVNSLLDPQHSYLEFTAQNTNALQTVGLDIGGGHVLFDEVRVEQGGRVLAREQSHNRLHASILSVAQLNMEGGLSESISQGQRGCNSRAGGNAGQLTPAVLAGGTGDEFVNQSHNDTLQFAAGASIRFTMAMPTGLFTQDKLLPLPLVSQQNPITLVLVMTPSQNVGAWSAAPAVGDISINRINYVAQMIEVGSDVIGQMRMMQEMGGGQLTISSTDIEHSTDVIPANSTGEIPIRIPARKKSIKSLLFAIQSDDYTQAAPGSSVSDFMSLSFGGNANMNTYQMKVGSVVYPPTPVQCWGNVARAAGVALPLPIQERGECAMELAKALGSLGFTNPTGRLSTLIYGTNCAPAVAAGQPPLADGDNGDGAGNDIAPIGGQEVCACPFGLDLAAFQHTAIESGIDSETMAMETTLIIDVNAVASGIEDKNVHCYLLYDQHYYFNSDGSVTFSN
tara:strand:+ start:143 stop:1651 length:1509 start_codon:yes stop_codon:yes gene_type:complete